MTTEFLDAVWAVLNQSTDGGHDIRILLAILGLALKYLRDLSRSVEGLNRNLAVVVERLDGHENRIDDHEARLRSVEKKPDDEPEPLEH